MPILHGITGFTKRGPTRGNRVVSLDPQAIQGSYNPLSVHPGFRVATHPRPRFVATHPMFVCSFRLQDIWSKPLSLSLSLTAISALSTRRSSPVSLRCQEMSRLWVFMTWMFNLPKSSGVSPHSLHPSFLFRNHAPVFRVFGTFFEGEDP